MTERELFLCEKVDGLVPLCEKCAQDCTVTQGAYVLTDAPVETCYWCCEDFTPRRVQVPA